MLNFNSPFQLKCKLHDLNFNSIYIFEFEKPKFQFERKGIKKYTGTGNDKSFATLYIRDVCITAFWRQKISLHSNSLVNMADNVTDKGDRARLGLVLPYENQHRH